MDTSWSRPTKYIASILLIALGIFVIYLSRSVIPLLVIAGLIAMIVRPLISWLNYRGRLPRGLAVALVYLLVIFLIPALLALAIPAIVQAFNYVIRLDYLSLLEDILNGLRSALVWLRDLQLPVPQLDNYLEQIATSLLSQLQPVSETAVPQPPPVEQIIPSLGEVLTRTFGAATGIVGAVLTNTTLFIFLILSSVYMSLGARSYREWFMRQVPEAYRPEISVLFFRIGRTWNAFFRGQITLMIVIGVVTWAGLTALGLPGAPSLGIVAGLLEIIPNLGPILATIPAAIVALLQGSSYLPVSNLGMVLIVIGFYIVVQQLENNLIVPRLLGDAVDLPPLVVMTGVLAGASAFGVLGALLATPVIASMREVLRYVYRKILGEVPYPPGEVLLDPTGLHFGELVQFMRRRFPRLTPKRVPSQGETVLSETILPPEPVTVTPAKITENFLYIEGMRIHYYAGEARGPAVVLLHGGGIDSARLSWELFMPEISGRFQVIAPDFPGYGESDKPPGFPYTSESLVRFLDQFLNALGIEKAALAGISMGGSVALGYTLEHHERVERLVLVDSYGLQRKAPLHRLSYLFVRAPGVNALTWSLMRRRAAVKYTLRALLRRSGSLTQELLDLAMFEVQRPGADRAWSAFQRSEMTWAGTRTQYLDRLGEIRVPTLIVHGAKDSLVPPRCAREANQRIAGSRLAWIEGAGHWPQRDDPQAFNRVVRAFLEEE